MHVMEFMEEGILTTFIGMGVVFTVLVVLSLFIKYLNAGVDAVVGKKRVENKPAEIVPPSPAKDLVTSKMKAQEGISPAVVAAITASICAITGKTGEEFKFTAIRKVSGSHPAWAFMGTTDIIATRQRYTERGNR